MNTTKSNINNKDAIINKILSFIKEDLSKLTRDNILRGRRKIISESDMYNFWNSFGECKNDVINKFNEKHNKSNCVFYEDPECDNDESENIQFSDTSNEPDESFEEEHLEMKNIDIMSIECRSGRITVPVNFNVKQILESLNLDPETGNYRIHVNSVDVTTKYETFIPQDGSVMRIASAIKGNK